MGHLYDSQYDESADSPYLTELEFPEALDSWDLADFEELIPGAHLQQ